MKIVESSNRRAVEALLSPERTQDAATDARVAAIVADVRRRGRSRAAAIRKDPRSTERTRSRSRSTRCAARPRQSRARFVRRFVPPHATFAQSRSGRFREPGASRVTSGVSVEQRVVPLDRVGCYVPGGRYPLPSSLLMTAIPAVAAGVREWSQCARVLNPWSWPRRSRPACRGCSDLVVLTRLPRSLTELNPFPESTRSWDPATGGSPRQRHSSRPTAGSTSMRGRARFCSSRRRAARQWIAADLIAQAEHDPDARAVLITPNRRLATQVATEVAARMPADGPARLSLRGMAASS